MSLVYALWCDGDACEEQLKGTMDYVIIEPTVAELVDAARRCDWTATEVAPGVVSALCPSCNGNEEPREAESRADRDFNEAGP